MGKVQLAQIKEELNNTSSNNAYSRFSSRTYYVASNSFYIIPAKPQATSPNNYDFASDPVDATGDPVNSWDPSGLTCQDVQQAVVQADNLHIQMDQASINALNRTCTHTMALNNYLVEGNTEASSSGGGLSCDWTTEYSPWRSNSCFRQGWDQMPGWAQVADVSLPVAFPVLAGGCVVLSVACAGVFGVGGTASGGSAICLEEDATSAAGSEVASGAEEVVPFATITGPDGIELPGIPNRAIGVPTETGNGLNYEIPPGTPGLNSRVVSIRVMDPVTSGPYQYPGGYISYMNESGQTVNPLSGQTIARSDPFAHIPLPPR